MKKNGFIAISVVYSFFIIFMMLLLLIISSYVNNRYTFDIYKFDVKHKYASGYSFTYNGVKLLQALNNLDETLNPNSGWDLVTEAGATRVQGPIPDNYICIPTDTDANCQASTKNLYQIVGIYDSSFHGVTGQNLIKVVKYRKVTTLAMSSTATSNWASTSMYQYLNTTFYNELMAQAPDLIYENNVRWYTKGTSASAVTPDAARKAEFSTSPVYVTGKIGLLNTSDWAYASLSVDTSAVTNNTCRRTLKLNEYKGVSSDAVKKTCNLYNWYKPESVSSGVWFLDYTGSNSYHLLTTGLNLTVANRTAVYDVRPAFYLNPDLTVISGTGSLGNPYIVGVIDDA